MSITAELDPDLAAALRMVGESTALDGPRFQPHTVRALTRMVLSRAFGKPMLELSYLVAIAAASGRPTGRYEAFFWNERAAVAGVFRAWLQGAQDRGLLPGGRLTIGTDGGKITTDHEPFTVQYTRMPLLVALAEFLMSTIGYPAFDAAVAPLTAGPMTKRGVSDVANALSRALHGYLQDRLDTGHAQRKMHAVLDHLRARGRTDAASIDDDAILTFWRAWSGTDEIDGVRTFRGVATGFLHLRDALTAAQDRARLDQAKTIGPDREAGEVDPGAVEAALAEVDADDDVIRALTGAPLDRVKFCNQGELAQTETIALYGRHGSAFIRTALRHEVFGDAQARISQALRCGAHWRQEPAGSYETQAADYRRLHEQLDRVLWASLHVLIELESAAVVDLLQALRPDLDLSDALPSPADDADNDARAGNVIRLAAASPVQRFLHLLKTQPDTLGPALSEMATTARRAFGKVARKGFGGEELADPAVAEAFRAAPPVLRRLSELLSRFSRLVNTKPEAELKRMFEDDCTVFYEQFERLYGGA